jgi:aminopeptidase N
MKDRSESSENPPNQTLPGPTPQSTMNAVKIRFMRRIRHWATAQSAFGRRSCFPAIQVPRRARPIMRSPRAPWLWAFSAALGVLLGPEAVRPAPASPPTLRLPPAVRPIHADLELTINPTQDTFRGRVTYDLQLSEATTTLWLNAKDLKISQASLHLDDTLVQVRVRPGNEEVIGLELERSVAPSRARLSLEWEGLLDKDRSRGLYRMKEGQDWYVYSFFEPIDARRAFPGFDEPSCKIPWKLTLHVPKTHRALANTPSVSETEESEGMKRVIFAESKPMPSYLVALVVGPFDVVDAGTAGRHGTPLRFIVPKGRGVETRYAAEITPKLVGLLEDYFDLPYPFEKLDVAVVPDYWGTMEHPGLVALGQPLTLIKPGEETTERKQSYANIAVHELGHYWLGDLVTMAWWDDTWLNEALTTWLDAKMTDAFEPQWRYPLQEMWRTRGAMQTDSLISAKRIRQPIVSKDDIQDAFDGAITYYKGAAVISMMEHWIGPEKFRRMLRDYLCEHRWGNATTADFLQTLTQAAGPDAGEAFRSFIDQPGVPLVTATWAREGTTARLVLAQERFLAITSAAPQTAVWKVPLRVRYGSTGSTGAVASLLLVQATGSLELPQARPPDWIMLNAGGLGYYRVAYDEHQLAALFGSNAPPLSIRERLCVLDDANALVERGDLPIKATLALIPGLAPEEDRLFVEASLRLARRIPLGRLSAEDRARLARFYRAAWGARAAALGWDPKPADSSETRLLRNALVPTIAEYGEDAGLRAGARQRVDRWFADRNAAAAELVDSLLFVAALEGDRALFDRCLAQAKRASDRRERGQILNALGAFRNPALLEAALALLDSEEFDMRESIGILYQALSGPDTKLLAWTWLKSHFDALALKLRDDEKSWLVDSLGYSLYDRIKREELENFFRSRVNQFDGGPIALTRTLEALAVRAGRAERNLPGSVEFLKAY